MIITLYHNFRCSKSQKTLEILQEKKRPFRVVDYLFTPLTAKDLVQLLATMKLSPRDIIRTNEYYYEALGLGSTTLSDDELITAIVKYPILMQRPIVVSAKGAIIARPPKKVLEIL